MKEYFLLLALCCLNNCCTIIWAKNQNSAFRVCVCIARYAMAWNCLLWDTKHGFIPFKSKLLLATRRQNVMFLLGWTGRKIMQDVSILILLYRSFPPRAGALLPHHQRTGPCTETKKAWDHRLNPSFIGENIYFIQRLAGHSSCYYECKAKDWNSHLSQHIRPCNLTGCVCKGSKGFACL